VAVLIVNAGLGDMEKFEPQLNQSEPMNFKENQKIAENQEKARGQEKSLKLDRIRWEVESWVDANGMGIDRNIKETVIMLNALDLPTSQSCEGHIDSGIPVPWVRIEAPDEPEERFIGQNAAFEKVAKKYNITLEEAKRAKIGAAYWEAMKECSKNDETEEYKKWLVENKILMDKTKKLLGEFYKNREVDPKVKLKIYELQGSFEVHNGGADYKPIIEAEKKLSEQEKKARAEKLEKYRAEMQEFTKFLKDKYFKS